MLNTSSIVECSKSIGLGDDLVPASNKSLPDYLRQCWPKHLSLYGVTKPYWVTAHHPWYAGTSTSKLKQNRRELWQLIELFWFTYHWDLFPWVQLKWINIGSTNGLTPNRCQVISEPVYRYVTRHTVISWDLFGSSQDIFLNIIGYDNTTDVIPLNRWRVLNAIYTMRLIRNSSERVWEMEVKNI